MPAKPKTVEEYFRTLDKEKQATLKLLRAALKKSLPKSEEVISYAMPAFKQEGIICWYAAAKNHHALYIYPRVKTLFALDLQNYGGTKSSIHFDYGQPLPLRLVTKIVKESLRQNLSKA